MTADPQLDAETPAPHTHRTVIESVTGTRMTVLAAGPLDHCAAVLADWQTDAEEVAAAAKTDAGRAVANAALNPMLLAVVDSGPVGTLVSAGSTMIRDALTTLHGEPALHPAVSHTSEVAALDLTPDERIHLLRALAAVGDMLLAVEAGEREDD